MIKTATNIIKGAFKKRNHIENRFEKISWTREKIIKHQDDFSIKKLLLKGFSIQYKRPYELLHTYKEIFEKEIYNFIADSPDPLIIDCGSNIGVSVLYFKQIYPNAKIIAFEPDPLNFDLLKLNVNQNTLKNIEIHQSAIWIKDGSISFASKESEASHISSQSTGNIVSSVNFNNLLNLYDSVDFLKMDIEGAEFEVIKEAKAQLVKVKCMFLEYHGKVNETRKLLDLLEIVDRAGFNVYFRNAADNLMHPFVEKCTNTQYDVQLNLFCYK